MGVAVEDKFIQKLKVMLDKPESSLLSPDNLARLKVQMKKTDIRLDLVRHLTTLVRERSNSGGCTEAWMKNILRIVGCIASPDNFGIDVFFNLDDPGSNQTTEENYADFKRRFSELWTEVMKWKMTPSVYKQVVILLPDRIMLHLMRPLLMSHFLLESFKIGGSVGLISLHGIFLLMQKYNFDVPDFYTKLYSMFTPEVMYSKYRPRFFAYSRDFLSSTHLPEYLVAAFAKKMSRLSLHAPAPAIPMICDFITNLMMEHPGLKTLVNKNSKSSKPGSVKQDASSGEWMIEEDPFNFDEPDPIKSRAMDSSLWEIKTLQSHVLPTIALAAKFISKTLPKVEKDLDETLELTYEDIFDKEKAGAKSLEPIPNHLVIKKFKFAYEL